MKTLKYKIPIFLFLLPSNKWENMALLRYGSTFNKPRETYGQPYAQQIAQKNDGFKQFLEYWSFQQNNNLLWQKEGSISVGSCNKSSKFNCFLTPSSITDVIELNVKRFQQLCLSSFWTKTYNDQLAIIIHIETKKSINHWKAYLSNGSKIYWNNNMVPELRARRKEEKVTSYGLLKKIIS